MQMVQERIIKAIYHIVRMGLCVFTPRRNIPHINPWYLEKDEITLQEG